MKINHTIAHYVIGLTALAAAGGSLMTVKDATHPVVIEKSTAAPQQVTLASRFAWESLGQDKSIALGEAIHNVSPGKITLYCSNLDCHALRTDIDDAMQIGNWKSSFEDQFVDSESQSGIFVGPPGQDAENFIKILEATTGLKAQITAIDGIDGLGLIIGKHDGAK